MHLGGHLAARRAPHQLKPPIPTIRAVSAWQRRSDRTHELELAAALEDGGGTGKDRGGDLVVEGQL
jgi:hypothetical protein